MKLKYKIMTVILVSIICTSIFLFSKLDETLYYSATTPNISHLSGIKQLVINEFKELSTISTASFHSSSSTNSIIVKFNEISNGEVDEFEDEFSIFNGVKLCDNLNIYCYQFKNNITLEILIELNQSDLVEYVEADYIVTPHTEIDKSWGLENQDYDNIDINVTEAWKKTKGNENLVVAVIDTGVDYKHPDLKENIWTNTKEIPNNNKDDDKNGYIDDTLGWSFAKNNNTPTDNDGHGTHVAGIIAATENDIGVVGIAPNIKIMPLDVFNGRLGSISLIIKAINYAKNNGASIINMSLTTTGYEQSLKDVIQKSSNTLFVCAAGNASQNNNEYPRYPASFNLPNNISVASINQDGELSSFSNYGQSSVHIAAPGAKIYSTLPNKKYGYKSGTSMAAPHVTGTAALIKSICPSYTPAEIKSKILTNVKKMGTLKGIVTSGGLVDAGKACK